MNIFHSFRLGTIGLILLILITSCASESPSPETDMSVNATLIGSWSSNINESNPDALWIFTSSANLTINGSSFTYEIVSSPVDNGLCNEFEIRVTRTADNRESEYLLCLDNTLEDGISYFDLTFGGGLSTRLYRL